MRIIKATKRNNGSDLEKDIRDILDGSLCEQIVNLAFSEKGLFSSEVFSDSDNFFDTIIEEEPKQVAIMFFEGKNLDRHGSANPYMKYFRLNRKGNVESTNQPGEIYYEDLLDEIVDYIMENIDEDVEFPDEIQELIVEYQNKE